MYVHGGHEIITRSRNHYQVMEGMVSSSSKIHRRFQMLNLQLRLNRCGKRRGVITFLLNSAHLFLTIYVLLPYNSHHLTIHSFYPLIFLFNRYNEILFLIDSCQAASMFKLFYSPNIIASSSSRVGEESLSVRPGKESSSSCVGKGLGKSILARPGEWSHGPKWLSHDLNSASPRH